MLEEIGKRFQELIPEGQHWARRYLANEYYVENGAAGWLTAAGNLVELVARGRGPYSERAKALLSHRDLGSGVPAHCVEQMVAVLSALYVDWNKGLVRQIEYLISAENFDAFLDHAEKYHKAGLHRESGVLVSSVFEDTIRKLAKKHGLDSNGEVDALIDQLVDREAVTPVAGRRHKAVAALRNKALHAKWDEFDLKDVGSAIKTVRELLEIL